VLRKKETPEEALSAALDQIVEKQYATELKAMGCKSIVKWAIAFKGKEVFLQLGDSNI